MELYMQQELKGYKKLKQQNSLFTSKYFLESSQQKKGGNPKLN